MKQDYGKKWRLEDGVPFADRWTDSDSSSEDGHPRDVEYTGRNEATGRGASCRELLDNCRLIVFTASLQLREDIPIFVCDVSSVVKREHVQHWHGNDTADKQTGKLSLSCSGAGFIVSQSSYLKAITMTRARMVPCTNLWLMQPWSKGELCSRKNKYIQKYEHPASYLLLSLVKGTITNLALKFDCLFLERDASCSAEVASWLAENTRRMKENVHFYDCRHARRSLQMWDVLL